VNRETRDKFASGTDTSDLTTGNACWETPSLVFAKLNADFGPFGVDLTADGQRRLCPRWFGPQSPVSEFDALTCEWQRYGTTGYSNPPYGSFVQKMLARAKEMARQHGFSSTLLLPMRVTKAFKAHVLKGASELLFADSRITFFEDGVPRCSLDKKGNLRPDPAMFDSIIVRYVAGEWASPRIGVWDVPPHVTADDIERARERMRKFPALIRRGTR
jgi:phage N-6-adenine-methyltransferase